MSCFPPIGFGRIEARRDERILISVKKSGPSGMFCFSRWRPAPEITAQNAANLAMMLRSAPGQARSATWFRPPREGRIRRQEPNITATARLPTHSVASMTKILSIGPLNTGQ
jgi:hypothetical protein